MGYLALYRKYRPQIFEEVVEQETVVKILQEALRQKKIAHAYLFSGPKGTGKTSVARIFAKGLNCEKGPTPTPCMKCKNCITISNGTNLDVIEIDAASNRGIDEIRDLKEKVRYAPISSRYKVYIIDEVHMLTPQAFNALLKTLEEPPQNVVFILATTAPEKLPATILSRCERFYFKPISINGLTKRIKEVAAKEGTKITDGAAMLIARFSSGSLRNALSLLDQAITMYEEIDEKSIRTLVGIPEEEILKDFLDSIIENNAKNALQILISIADSGKDSKVFINEFLMYMQDLITGKLLGFDYLAGKRDKDFLNTMRKQARYITNKRCVEISSIFAETLNNIRLFPDPFFPIELATLSCIKEEVSEEKIFTVEEQTKETKKQEIPIKETDALATVRTHWNDIITEVKRKNTPLGAILMRVNPVELKDNVLTLLPERKFYLEMLNNPDNIKILEEALKKILLKDIRITCIAPEEKKAFNKEEEIEKVKKKKEVKETLSLFDGVITDIKNTEEGNK